MPENTVVGARTDVNILAEILAEMQQANRTLRTIAESLSPRKAITDASVYAVLLSTGANVAAMARELGCDKTTLYRRPGFRDMIERARDAKKTSSRRGVIRKGRITSSGIEAEADDGDE